MRPERIALALAAAAFPAVGHAQAIQCNVPAELPQPRLEGPTRDQPRRLMPIGSYTLALIWSPEYCRGKQTSPRDRLQCSGTSGRFGFTLHGLWPDGRGEGWPQYCRPTRLVPEPVLRRNLCATPSVQLMQHEWEKHGTCMAASPEAYFRASTRLYRALRFPDMVALSRRTGLTVGQFAGAFAGANPGLTADMVKVTANKRRWLEEVWICLDTRLRPRRCPSNAGGAVRGSRLRIEAP